MAPHMRVRLSEGLPHFILNHFRADSWVRDPSVGLSIGSGCSAGREPSFQCRHALPDTPVGLDAQQEQLVCIRTCSGHLDLPTRGRSPDDGQSDGPRTLQIVGHVPELRQRWVPLYVARWRFFSIYSVSHDWGRIKAYFFMVNELWVQICLPPFFATCPFGSLEVVGPLKWPFSALEIKMLIRSSVTIYPLRFSDVQSSKFIFNMRSTLLWTFWETVHQIILHLFHQVALSFLGLTSMSVLSAWPRFESPTSRFLKVSWIFWRELIWVVFAKKKSWQLVSQCLYLFVLNA